MSSPRLDHVQMQAHQWNGGLAAAAGVIYFVLIFGLTVVQRLTVGRQEAA